jgi:hypothetical protein
MLGAQRGQGIRGAMLSFFRRDPVVGYHRDEGRKLSVFEGILVDVND